MPSTNLSDSNITEKLDVINNFDLGLADDIQYMLVPVYQKFPMLTKTIFGTPIANLIAAVLVLLFFFALRKAFTHFVMIWLQKLASKTSTRYDERVIAALKKPIAFSFILVGLQLFLVLTFQDTGTTNNILNSLVVFNLFWAIISIAEALKGLIYSATAKVNSDLSVEMGNFMLKILKVLIGAVGLGAMLQVWGINVTALIASLGLGGLAFALAAKDTASNLFGSFAILADKSIRIGEWIRVDGVEGTVEDIGMRTTKIRTFGKSLITVPNQVIANSPIENFSRRGVRRIKMIIGVTYNTDQTQMKNIVNQIEQMLKDHKDISSKETLMVNFKSFGDSALEIFVYCFTTTSAWSQYMDIKQDVQLKIMSIVEDNGSGFAFPSQSIYIESMPK